MGRREEKEGKDYYSIQNSNCKEIGRTRRPCPGADIHVELDNKDVKEGLQTW